MAHYLTLNKHHGTVNCINQGVMMNKEAAALLLVLNLSGGAGAEAFHAYEANSKAERIEFCAQSTGNMVIDEAFEQCLANDRGPGRRISKTDTTEGGLVNDIKASYDKDSEYNMAHIPLYSSFIAFAGTIAFYGSKLVKPNIRDKTPKSLHQ